MFGEPNLQILSSKTSREMQKQCQFRTKGLEAVQMRRGITAVEKLKVEERRIIHVLGGKMTSPDS